MQKGEARLTVSSGPRLAGASDGADTGGVNSKLSSMPAREAIADDLDPARVGHGDGEIHVGKAHIASVLADPGDSSRERESAGGKGAGGRTLAKTQSQLCGYVSCKLLGFPTAHLSHMASWETKSVYEQKDMSENFNKFWCSPPRC